jgi:hypothetical protein
MTVVCLLVSTAAGFQLQEEGSFVDGSGSDGPFLSCFTKDG